MFLVKLNSQLGVPLTTETRVARDQIARGSRCPYVSESTTESIRCRDAEGQHGLIFFLADGPEHLRSERQLHRKLRAQPG